MGGGAAGSAGRRDGVGEGRGCGSSKRSYRDSGPAAGSQPLHHLSRCLDSKGSFLRRVFLFLFF